jgi:hypothetical protein
MTAPPALVATTTLVAEAPWKAVLRRGLQAVAGGLDRLVPPHPQQAALRAGSSPRDRPIGGRTVPL